MRSKSLVSLGEGEELLYEYHVVQTPKRKRGLLSRLFRRRPDEVSTEGTVLLTDRRIIYCELSVPAHGEGFSDTEVIDVQLQDVLQVLAGYGKGRKGEWFRLSIGTGGGWSLEVGVHRRRGRRSKNLPGPAPEVSEFCKEIGAKILEVQSLHGQNRR